MTALSELTTLRLGGPARDLRDAAGDAELIAIVRAADASGDQLLVLGGGSNLVVADAGFDGTVARVLTRGVEQRESPDGVEVEAAAGESWDELVARCVADGLAGVECLAGIPGSVGATPIQNVGAYGQEVSDTIVRVRVFDRERGEERELAPEDCGFGYRTSAFKRDPGRHVVLGVTFALARARESEPLRYDELARRLDAGPGARVPLADVRDAVLVLRRAKGMVLDPADPDSVSAGSFFTNPVLTPERFAALAERAATSGAPPAFPQADGSVKTSAAWLVERAGFTRGYGLPGPVAISSKHTLALTNRGGASTAQLVALAREVALGVLERFGVELVPEPVFVGHAWEPLGAETAPAP